MQKRLATSCFSCLAVTPEKEGCILGFQVNVDWKQVGDKQIATSQKPLEKCYKPLTDTNLKEALEKTK